MLMTTIEVQKKLRAPYSLYVAVSMFINHGGIEQVKLWCEVRSIRVVFAAKYITSCVCVPPGPHSIRLTAI